MSKTKDRLLTLSEQRDKESVELAEIKVCKETDEIYTEREINFKNLMEQSENLWQDSYHN